MTGLSDTASIAGPVCYRIGPLRLRSDFDLPLMREAAGAAETDFAVRRVGPGAIPALPDGAAFAIREDGCIALGVPGAAHFLIRRGEALDVELAEGMDESEAGALILAGPLAALLCRRGLVPLRVATVAVGSAAIVLAGVSGIGKSTLAAALIARGARLVADDLCLFTPTGGGGLLAWSGVRRLAVWPDVLPLPGVAGPGERLRPGIERCYVDLPLAGSAPLPVCAVFVMRVGLSGATLCRPLSPAAAATDLLSRLVDRTPIRRFGVEAAALATVGRLCAAAPVFRLERSPDRAALTAMADVVLETVAAMGGAA